MPELVFWIDVDNTLLNNDQVKEILQDHMQVEVGKELNERFWNLYEQVRNELDLVDIPLTLERFRAQTSLEEMNEETYRHIHSIFDNFPFYQQLYPYTLETLRYLRTLGLTVIVSDGDVRFQAEKIFNSALAETVEGRVLLYIHKQNHLNDIILAYPADHYAMIDDKPQILVDMKTRLGDKLTTVFVRQGKYALGVFPDHFRPDITVEHFGDLQAYHAGQFLVSDGQ